MVSSKLLFMARHIYHSIKGLRKNIIITKSITSFSLQLLPVNLILEELLARIVRYSMTD
jgi:hypothetical protein